MIYQIEIGSILTGTGGVPVFTKTDEFQGQVFFRSRLVANGHGEETMSNGELVSFKVLSPGTLIKINSIQYEIIPAELNDNVHNIYNFKETKE